MLRLLDKSNLQLDMTKLGFEERALKDFKDAIYKPFGMVLVTGPTGSGKTTTLYSALSELNKIASNISTAEDPVEYNLVGINQVQINEDIGLTFASGAARLSAPGPRHHHGRRDPRLRRPPRSPSRRRSPATWCSARCTPTTPPARQPGS